MRNKHVHREDSFERYVRRTRRLEKVSIGLVILLVIGLALMALVGCAPKHGTVIQKQYLAAHYDYWQTYDCVAYTTTYSTYRNSNGSVTRTSHTRCVAHVLHSHRTWVNDRWGLRLKDGDNTGYRYVDLVTYNECSIGQYYDETRCS